MKLLLYLLIYNTDIYFFERFLYTCKIELDNYSGVDILQILITADKLGLESFYNYTMNFFIEKYEDYIKENPVKIIQSIYSNNQFIELKNIFLKKICEFSEELFQSS